MKFSIQLHYNIFPEQDTSENLLAKVKTLIENSEGKIENIENGIKDNISFSTFNVQVIDGVSFWNKIKPKIYLDSSIDNSLIVVAEGKDGWNNYLLLHHYEEGQSIDRLEEELPAWPWPTAESMNKSQEETFEDILEWTEQEESELLALINARNDD